MKTNGTIQLYPLVRIALMLIAGIVLGAYCYGKVNAVWWLVAEGVLLLGVLLGSAPIRQTVCLFGAVAVLGAYLYTRSAWEGYPLPLNRNVEYEAVLVTRPTIHGKVVRCELQVLHGEHLVSVTGSFFRDTLTGYWETLHPGMTVHACSAFTKPYGSRLYTFVYFTGWEPAPPFTQRLTFWQQLRLQLLLLRNRLVDRLELSGLSGDCLAVTSAMLLGDRTLISNTLKRSFAHTSTSHILALSGLHVSIIFGILFMLLPGGEQWKWLRLSAIPLVWGYVLLTGMSASVVRAALMLSLYVVVSLLHHRKFSLNTLAFAAIVMLVITPRMLWDVGFQLSFMAVVGICMGRPLFEPLRERLAHTWKPVRRLMDGAMITLSAQMGVLPLLLCYFHTFSTYFLVVNMAVVPLATGIIYVSFALLVLPGAAEWLAKPVIVLVDWLNNTVSYVADLPYASVRVDISALQALFLYVFMFSIYGVWFMLRGHRGDARY